MIKKLIISAICVFVAGLLFLVVFCAPNPEGGFYWRFVTYAPVVVGGDGSSYETAYKLKKGKIRWLATVECGLMHDRYGVEDDVLIWTNANLNGCVYDIISFPVPRATNAFYHHVYFDVTDYRQKK